MSCEDAIYQWERLLHLDRILNQSQRGLCQIYHLGNSRHLQLLVCLSCCYRKLVLYCDECCHITNSDPTWHLLVNSQISPLVNWSMTWLWASVCLSVRRLHLGWSCQAGSSAVTVPSLRRPEKEGCRHCRLEIDFEDKQHPLKSVDSVASSSHFAKDQLLQVPSYGTDACSFDHYHFGWTRSCSTCWLALCSGEVCHPLVDQSVAASAVAISCFLGSGEQPSIAGLLDPDEVPSWWRCWLRQCPNFHPCSDYLVSCCSSLWKSEQNSCHRACTAECPSWNLWPWFRACSCRRWRWWASVHLRRFHHQLDPLRYFYCLSRSRGSCSRLLWFCLWD